MSSMVWDNFIDTHKAVWIFVPRGGVGGEVMIIMYVTFWVEKCFVWSVKYVYNPLNQRACFTLYLFTCNPQQRQRAHLILYILFTHQSAIFKKILVCYYNNYTSLLLWSDIMYGQDT